MDQLQKVSNVFACTAARSCYFNSLSSQNKLGEVEVSGI